MGMIDLHATYLLLKRWKKDSTLPKKEIGTFSRYLESRNNNEPFSTKEISRLRDRLRKYAPTSYKELF